MITPTQIEELSNRPEVKTRAVQNFLGTLHGMSYQEALGNAEMDAKSYRWNYETIAAIREGLLNHFYPKKS